MIITGIGLVLVGAGLPLPGYPQFFGGSGAAGGWGYALLAVPPLALAVSLTGIVFDLLVRAGRRIGGAVRRAADDDLDEPLPPLFAGIAVGRARAPGIVVDPDRDIRPGRSWSGADRLGATGPVARGSGSAGLAYGRLGAGSTRPGARSRAVASWSTTCPPRQTATGPAPRSPDPVRSSRDRSSTATAVPSSAEPGPRRPSAATAVPCGAGPGPRRPSAAFAVRSGVATVGARRYPWPRPARITVLCGQRGGVGYQMRQNGCPAGSAYTRKCLPAAGQPGGPEREHLRLGLVVGRHARSRWNCCGCAGSGHCGGL